MKPTIEFDPTKHAYTLNGKRVPGVTSILGTVIDKSAWLKGWAANETIRGVCTLTRKGVALEQTYEGLKGQLKDHKLGYYYSTRSAQDRGTLIHSAAEDWAKHGQVPLATSYPEHVRGYVRALAQFLIEHRPTFEASEVVVGSAKHGYAGTYDATVQIDGRRGRIDYKTSKAIDTAYWAQLDAYDIAAVECGEPAADFLAVVRLGQDGTFEFVESRARRGCFLPFLAAYRELKAIEAAHRKR